MPASSEQFNFRVDSELKEAFIKKARENGTTASELLVGFMQQYLGIESRSPVAVVDSSGIEQRLYERLSGLIDERIAQALEKSAA
ncbi:MAG: hypothetical protein AB1861_29300 [Cyanobacteriota bacterium]